MVQLRHERRLDTSMLARAIQKDESAARNVLERLVEVGLVEAHGVKKGRTFTLSARVYRDLGSPADYVRQAGFDPIQQEQMVMRYVKQYGKITRSDVMDLCKLGPHQAYRLLTRLTEEQVLQRTGRGKATAYARGSQF